MLNFVASAGLLAVLSSTLVGRTATLQSLVTSTVGCDALSGLTIPAASIGLPTSGARVTSAVLVAATPLTVTAGRAVLALPESCKILGSEGQGAPTSASSYRCAQ